MNRKEAGYAIAGMLGAVVGAGCASPQASETLPSAARSTAAAIDDYTPIPIALFLSDSQTSLSLFRRQPPIRASSTIERILSVLNTAEYVQVRPREKGQCQITIRDTLTGAGSRFDVDVGDCKNGHCPARPPASHGEAREEPRLGLYILDLLLGSKNTFKKDPIYTASTDSPLICSVTDTGDRMEVLIVGKGGGKVLLKNASTGDESHFVVRCTG